MTHPVEPDDPSHDDPSHDDPDDPDDQDFDQRLDDASREARERADSLAGHLAATVDEIGSIVNAAADDAGLAPDNPLERAVTTAPVLPMEYYRTGDSRSQTATAMRKVLDRRLAVYRGTDPAAVQLRADARAAFVAVVLGIGGTTEAGVTQVADGVLERLRGALHNEPTSSAVGRLADGWVGAGEELFWSSLAAGTRNNPELAARLVAHLGWMGLVCELSPMEDDFGWQRPRDQQRLLETLVSAAGEDRDIAAVYDVAAELRYGGAALPRAVMAESVQLALANLDGARVDRAQRDRVLNTQTPRPDPSLADSELAAATRDYTARETMRQKALSFRTALPSTAYQDRQRPVRAAAYRYALGELWATGVSGIRAAVARAPDGARRKARLDGVLSNSRLPELLDAWSPAVGADVPDVEALATISTDLGIDLGRLRTDLAATYGNPVVGAIEQGLEVFLVDIANEVADETADVLSDHWVPAHPLDGVRAEISWRRRAPNLLGQARQAVQTVQGMRAYVTGRIRDAAALLPRGQVGNLDLTDVPWLTTVADAAGRLPAAVVSDDPNRVAGTVGAFTGAVELARASAAALLRDTPAAYTYLRQFLDAITLASCERFDALLDASTDPDLLTGAVVSSLDKLRSWVDQPQELAEPASAWSKGKDALLGELPAAERKTLETTVFTDNLNSALSDWKKAVDRRPVDVDTVKRRTWAIVDILRAYRLGVSGTVTDPATSASFQDLIDAISLTVDLQLARLDRTAPPRI